MTFFIFKEVDGFEALAGSARQGLKPINFPKNKKCYSERSEESL
jgi:hypothetical protein